MRSVQGQLNSSLLMDWKWFSWTIIDIQTFLHSLFGGISYFFLWRNFFTPYLIIVLHHIWCLIWYEMLHDLFIVTGGEFQMWILQCDHFQNNFQILCHFLFNFNRVFVSTFLDSWFHSTGVIHENRAFLSLKTKRFSWST